MGAGARLLLLLPSTTYRATAFVEAARRLDVELTVASDQNSVFSGREPERLVTLDFARRERAAEQAAAFAAEHPVAAVVGVDDDTAVLAAAIAERLDLPHNPVAATLAARNKLEQRATLAAARVPVPEFRVHDLDEEPGAVARSARYPCVLKPLCLSASRGVIRADTVEQFLAAHRVLSGVLGAPEVADRGAESRRYLVESFVPGPEFAVEGLLEDGRLRVLALFDKPDPLEGPYFEETIYVTPSRLEAAARRALADCAGRAAAALGLVSGPVHVELRLNDAGPWLIELGARPIGGRCSAALRFGEGAQAISLEELLLRRALGRPVPTFEREAAAAGVMMIPVPGAGVLRAVRGVDAARAVPGVVDVAITAHVGQTLVPPPLGAQYPGFLFARGASPGDVVSALRQAHAHLRFELESQGG
ncbi:MAG TPA: ATP-grasp domain-containing protein [Gemmatimonadales bacterium]|nr:ATP-grasp domain-containing protein [Gemmatimonadales bacterium]